MNECSDGNEDVESILWNELNMFCRMTKLGPAAYPAFARYVTRVVDVGKCLVSTGIWLIALIARTSRFEIGRALRLRRIVRRLLYAMA